MGIDQSIDVGNFITSETAVLMLDSILASWGVIPRAGNVPLEDILTAAIGVGAAHEVGHYTGARHTVDTNSTTRQIMDVGLNRGNLVGVGPDGVFGTVDDENVQFGTDSYDPLASAYSFGMQNSATLMAWGLSTGTVGGATIQGKVYQDNNGNRQFNAGDVPLTTVTVYVDANNNR